MAVKATAIKRDLLADQATDELRRLIVLGDLAPGHQITERELTGVLGISRTPIREAMRTLALEGLITPSDTGRYFIANPTVEEFCDLLRIIGALEGLAGRLACQYASDSQLKKIASLQERMQKLKIDAKRLEYFETNIEFHRKIVEASGNEALVKTHKTLNDRLYRARYLCSLKSSNRTRALTEHSKIVTALLERDSGLVEQNLRQHMVQAESNVAETFAALAGSQSGRPSRA